MWLWFFFFVFFFDAHLVLWNLAKITTQSQKEKKSFSIAFRTHIKVALPIILKPLGKYWACVKISNYDNFLIAEDFNSETLEFTMINFCDMYHLVKYPIYFKNLKKSSYIDRLFTIFLKWSIDTQTLKTELSDFNKLTVIVLKMYYQKKIFFHRKIIFFTWASIFLT